VPDGFDDDSDNDKVIARERAALRYPFTQLPVKGERLEVAPGVHWIRMPLPYALNHINLWALDDGDAGSAVVDTGVCTDETMQLWQRLFTQPSGDASGSGSASSSTAGTSTHAPTRVFVTHMHPDHVGMAGWMTRRFGVSLWMTRLEYLTCRVLASDTGREAPADGIEFYRRAGWPDAALQTYRVRFGGFGKHIHALPDSYHRLHDGEVIRIGAHDWRVIIGSGHSPEHACLHCPALKLLISGDQVLPRISSNVSVYPTEPDADPMSDWLASIAKLRREIPDAQGEVLVLPAHNEPFYGLHARLDALERGQHVALTRLKRTLAARPRRAIDVFGALFGRAIESTDVALLGMATGESLACLNHLMHAGQVHREIDQDGVAWYRMAA
jgi:glyoxylase-like metal-dependent hydrolase (beta-lactamase superfamily II)